MRRGRDLAAEFGRDTVERFRDAIDAGRDDGLLEVEADAVRLTPSGRLLASEALLRFVAMPETRTTAVGGAG